MIFSATRFENNALIRCEADNIVMRNEKDKPLHDTLALEVLCEYKKKTEKIEQQQNACMFFLLRGDLICFKLTFAFKARCERLKEAVTENRGKENFSMP